MGEMNRKKVQSGTWIAEEVGCPMKSKVEEIFRNLGEGVDLGIEK